MQWIARPKDIADFKNNGSRAIATSHLECLDRSGRTYCGRSFGQTAEVWVYAPPSMAHCHPCDAMAREAGVPLPGPAVQTPRPFG